MAKALPRKALISISSFNGAIYPNGHKTGLFFTEALHPFEVLTQAGFEVDLASETGTYGLDEISLTDPFLAGSDKAVFGPDRVMAVFGASGLGSYAVQYAKLLSSGSN